MASPVSRLLSQRSLTSLVLLSSLVFLSLNGYSGETTTATSSSTVTTTTITSTITSGRVSCPGPGCPGEYISTLILSPVSGPTGTVVTVTGSNYAGTTCTLSSSPSGLFSSSACSISAGILTGGFTIASTDSGNYVVTTTTDAGESVGAAFALINDLTLGYLSVNFDKATYYAGDTVHITGDISTPRCTWTYTGAGGLAVNLSILDPNGSTILTVVTDPSAAGYKNYAYDYVIPASVSSGTYIPPYTVLVSYSACGTPVYGSGTFQVVNPYWFAVSVDRTSYACGDSVLATAVVQLLLGSPAAVPGATVIFEIHTPSGSVLATGSSITDPIGVARFQFALPSTCDTGTYVAYASTTIPKIGGQGNITLDVHTNIPVSQAQTGRTHVTITLSATDSTGNPKSAFSRGETVLVKIVVANDGNLPLDNAHILLTIYDPNNVPIFFGISVVSLNAGQQQTQLLGMPLGSTLSAGTFRGEVVVLTDFLTSGGHYVPDGSGAVTFVVT